MFFSICLNLVKNTGLLNRFISSILCFTLLSCSMTIPKEQAINGVSFVAANEAIDQSHVEPVVKVNANYASIMPFGFLKNINAPDLIYSSERQWFGETLEGSRQYISELQKGNIKIMIKPQVWVWKGEFTGDIFMKSEADWKQLENSYSAFILDYAKLAQEVDAEIFCIGTELELFVKYRPNFWTDLIKRIKSVYKGKLTYAANWDEYRRVPFWFELDFIGIDAYFPVSDMKTPTVEDCKKGWQGHKSVMKSISQQYSKQILFTEFGYRSMDFTGKEPWQSDYKIKSINFQGQTNATKALFEEFWYEEWFAGGFIWKWFHKHNNINGNTDNQFTPQNKPVEQVISEYFDTY